MYTETRNSIAAYTKLCITYRKKPSSSRSGSRTNADFLNPNLTLCVTRSEYFFFFLIEEAEIDFVGIPHVKLGFKIPNRTTVIIELLAV